MKIYLLKIIDSGDIGAGEFGLIAFDNSNFKGSYDICGTVTWNMIKENEFPWRILGEDGRTFYGRLLNIAYRTYWE